MKIILALALLVSGCSSMKEYNEYDLQTDFNLQRYEPVIAYYKARIKNEEGSSVLNNLNLAMVYQNMGDYKSSNGILINVSRHIDLTNEYISISEETFSLALDDSIKRYTFEEYEIVFLYYSMAINFLMQGDMDNAIVQARKIDARSRYVENNDKPWSSHEMSAYYLSGTLHELGGNIDSAYIDYKRAEDAKSKVPYLNLDLWSAGMKAGRDVSKVSVPKAYKKFKTTKAHKQMAEVLVFINNGWSPVKTPHKYNGDIPVFASRFTQNDFFTVRVNNLDKGRSYPMMSIEEAAKENLKRKFAYYRNRSFVKFAATEALLLPVGLGAGGMLLRGATHSRDKSDFRSWAMMPKEVQVIKFYASPGENTIVVKGLDGVVAGEFKLNLRSGQKKVLFIDHKN